MPVVRSIVRRTLVVSAGAVAGLVLTAGIASAHVTIISPDPVTRGGDAELVLRVPNEQDAATVTRIELDFPQDTPLSNASPRPVSGWSVQVNQANLRTPVKMADDTVTNAVSSIVWTAQQPGAAVPVNDFQEFAFWTEGLPTNTDTLVFSAVQTYSNGNVVTWTQRTGPNGQEPDNPAPELAFADPAPTSAATSSDGLARWLGGVGLVLAAIALGFGLGSLGTARRSARRARTSGGSRL
jgi:uncharacterized protein YcnI